MKSAKPKETIPGKQIPVRDTSTLYQRIREILESARAGVARTVNTSQVIANWLIGREIVEEEQHGKKRAEYGEQILMGLADRLEADFGNGYSVHNLKFMRRFYQEYSSLISPKYAAARQIIVIKKDPKYAASSATIGYALRSQSNDQPENTAGGAPASIPGGVSEESWQPGQLHSSLSWTHYRTLLRAKNVDVRNFYEIEAIKNNWSARELERQMCSLLYERLALSRDKKGLMRLATKGHEIQNPTDVFKDPVVMEFLGLPRSMKLVESEMEQAVINNLQTFLLELGKGFAFISRQERITLDGDHFYIDLVFYHAVLKCFVLIDLKVGKLTHGDLGQMQLYVNYYDRERRTAGDNPTLGLILCTDKNDAVVKYLLGPDQSKKIFTSRYKLHLPSEAELVRELKRETQALK